MNPRTTAGAAALTVALGAAAVALPGAASASPAPAPQAASAAPAALCGADDWFDIHYVVQYPSPNEGKETLFRRKVPTRGGCASSWARGDGQLSTAALAAQCRTGLEALFGPYPFEVRFAETYLLETRADCIAVMTGISQGLIDPGPAPLFPGGQ